ncbi:MAG: MopE-related protein [Desulfobacterales bacterium]
MKSELMQFFMFQFSVATGINQLLGRISAKFKFCNKKYSNNFVELLVVFGVSLFMMLSCGGSGGSGVSSGSGDSSNIPDAVLSTYYRDIDDDGYGDPNNSIEANSQPTGYVSVNTDCNDIDADIHPDAIEICKDGINQDCNEYVDCDEKLTPNQKIFDSVEFEEWEDYEIDLSSNGDLEIKLVNLSDDVDLYVKRGDLPKFDDYDCESQYSGIMEETCSLENEGNNTWYVSVYGYFAGSYELHVLFILPIWYIDSDGDGYGDPNNSIEADSQPVGYVLDDTDCDDSDAEIYPDAIEICNDGIDQNCDGDPDCPKGYPPTVPNQPPIGGVPKPPTIPNQPPIGEVPKPPTIPNQPPIGEVPKPPTIPY